MMRRMFVLAAATLAASAMHADARLFISTAATQNMTCSGGVCAPTSHTAVLNVTDLENLLAAGDLEITDYGGRKAYAGPIDIESPFGWSTSSLLSLSANAVNVDQLVSVQGAGGVLSVNQLAFGPRGRISFATNSSSLTIDGTAYTLVSTLPGVAAAIAANPAGVFALADSYDASQDGTYNASPIPTNFNGTLYGVGNTISNISVNNTDSCCVGGLFESISQAYVFDLRLRNVDIVSTGGAAGLAYESFGDIHNVSVTGSVTGGAGDIGGLVADNYGSVYDDYSKVAVSAGATVNGSDMGGLIGAEFGLTSYSFATGAVSAGNGSGNIGGLVGEIEESGDEYCYATGKVSGGSGLNVGGFAGQIDYGAQVNVAYSTGDVSGISGSNVGGFAGVNNYYVGDGYWDTTTSGTNIAVGLGNDSSITGLTTGQLQSGLPAGFQSNVWAEKAKINKGLPYLLANPPPG